MLTPLTLSDLANATQVIAFVLYVVAALKGRRK